MDGVRDCSHFGRAARTTSPLYGALMDSELAVSVGSALLPTEEPYLYGFSATLRDGVDHGRAESALFEALESMSAREVTANELEKAKNQVSDLISVSSGFESLCADDVCDSYHSSDEGKFSDDEEKLKANTPMGNIDEDGFEEVVEKKRRR